MNTSDTTTAPPAGLVPGLDALGAYHLLRPLGSGGMARVWLAVDGRTGRKVAVKRMLPQVALDEELRRAFLDEAALGLQLRHANIVETLELGEAATAIGDEPYLVLELLQGRPLIEMLRAVGRQKIDIPLGVVVRTVCDAARALDYAHRLTGADGRPLGVVHRDVTPHNVFVCEDGSIKLVDFGIAKHTDQSHKTQTGLIKGKLAYLAPEQIKGKVLDARADVFALGIVLHELIVGRPLFRGGNDAETLHRVLTQEIVAPDLIRKGVPDGLSAIALRALQRDPERRLPSAGALADAIEAVAEAAGIDATREAVREFEERLFPADAEEHAEDRALAQRTYEHLSSSQQLRAIETNPWLTPAEGVPPVETKRTSVPLLALGVLLVLASVALFLLPHPKPPVAVQRAAPAVPAPPAAAIVELPAPPPLVVDATPKEEPKVEHHVAVAPKHVATGRGSLRIAAQPWADVTLDGKALGTTPLRSTSVAEGTHNVVMTNRDLGALVHRRVVVHAGQESVLVVDLFAQKK